MIKYNPQKIEKKWQDRWDESEIYKAEDFSKKKKFYCLIEFPYPSGAGLHVGHLRSQIAIDIVVRKKRMSGFNVLYPIGWDAFGLPTENFAIKTKTHPKVVTKNNVKNFTRQIKSYGPSFDWSREINTTDPKYYKWTQWIFLKLFNSFYDEKLDKARDVKELEIPKDLNDLEKREFIDNHRLAYEAEMAINWCPSCKIGLANEEVVNNACERCGTQAEKKNMKQWMLRITKYADRLIKDLDTVDYLDKIKTQQVNWIGKSEGATIKFKVVKTSKEPSPEASGLCSLEVFTTRPDTLFGCTYMVVAPEHPLIKNLESGILNLGEVKKYIQQAKNKSDLDRTDLAKEKTGVELKGIKAINPVNNKEIPIWVADYVLASYGTGAIMAVPAHDERDFEFARKFGLEIRQVVKEFIKQTEAQKQTLKSYNNNVDKYFEKTISEISGEFKGWLDYILSLVSKDSTILEVGSGTGKDADYMESLGYKIERTDGSTGFIKYQKAKGKSIKILNLISDEIDYLKYDLIFANAVLLHFDEQQTKTILKKINNGLKESGILAFSVKAGEGEEVTDQKLKANRYFKYWSIDEIKKMLNKLPLEIIKIEPWKDKRGVVFIWIVVKKKTNSIDLVYRGVNINSDFLNNLETKEAKNKITKWLEKNNLGKKATNFKLRDWVFSRQHYWGEPIPIVKCKKCGNVALEEKDLPLELPDVEKYEPTETGESPLAKISKWVNVKCPKCGGNAKRETDTMPNWAGSSWYFLRYIDPKNDKEFVSPEKLKYWMPVDLYNGGMEHTTLHLLYSRFWHKFLYDLDYVNTSEPYAKRRSHGMILAEDGQKMSKSRGNVVNPDEVIEKYGADTVRLYEMFMGPYGDAIPWSINSLIGMNRFLERVWNVETRFIASRFIAPKNTPKQKTKILIATNNQGKLKELKNHLGDFNIISLENVDKEIIEPKENGKTFEDNSLIKAKYYAKKTGYLTIADDSGLCINALNGRPGVFSSRYACGDYEKANLKLLKELENQKDRSAYYQCVITLYDPENNNYEQFVGKCEGEIIKEPRGNKSFGYAPIFLSKELQKTFGECSEEERYRYNHRKRATDKLVEYLNKVETRFIASEISSKSTETLLHQTIKKVAEDIENLKFNTAISQLMILLNEIEKQKVVSNNKYSIFLILLSPFAPHITEELWKNLGNKESIHLQSFPKYNPELIKEKEITLVIQINGKLRDQIKVSADISEEEAKKISLESEKIKKWTEGKEIRKIIFVKGRLVNVVV